MRTVFLIPLLLFLLVSTLVPAQTGEDLVRQVHKRYYLAPCKTFTFSQKNTHYKNDTVSGHSEWYEAIEFPDKFRIDFGDRSKGNYVIFKHDSAFNYKKDELVKTKADSSTLLLLLGGMFYREIGDVLKRLKHANYNIKVMSLQKWKGQDTYVIGAKAGDLKSNQVWIDKKTLRVIRIIEQMNEEDTMDMRFEAHQDWCKGYSETRVSFRRNGRLEQEEEYYDIKVVDRFPE